MVYHRAVQNVLAIMDQYVEYVHAHVFKMCFLYLRCKCVLVRVSADMRRYSYRLGQYTGWNIKSLRCVSIPLILSDEHRIEQE